MSSPPDPPSNQPNEPDQPPSPSRNNKRTGAFVALAAVVLISLIVELLGGGLGFGAGLLALPVVSLVCVILGSILTIPKRTRQFAVGFLITSAILLFVTAGVCVALFAGIANQL